MILVDSSVWITAWRGQNSLIIDQLSRLVESGKATINYLIRTELLQGAKDRHHQKTLKDLLSPIPLQPFPDTLWEEAPALYLKAREHGITLTTVDCLIATHALISSLSLWSLDGVFQKVPGIRLLTGVR